ncbi:MAG: ABC transporter ATP-binding protein [Treponema sp.]|nr:ABC transporter ATP-binding protein [Treponema sp.]
MSNPAISFTNITKTFRISSGKKTALDDVSLTIEQGSCTIIAGENGSGKSVLMSIAAGLMDCDSGKVECDSKLGLVFQEAETQILGETPAEDIAFGPVNLGWKKEQVTQAVEEALQKTGLTEKKDYPARFLSGGEKRRLAVACMLAMNFSTIILDEPYANLDLGGVRQVNALVQDLKKEGKTVIILTHEIEKCLGLADKFAVLFQGRLVFDGAPADALKQKLEQWNIRNPLVHYDSVKDLVW